MWHQQHLGPFKPGSAQLGFFPLGFPLHSHTPSGVVPTHVPEISGAFPSQSSSSTQGQRWEHLDLAPLGTSLGSPSRSPMPLWPCGLLLQGVCCSALVPMRRSLRRSLLLSQKIKRPFFFSQVLIYFFSVCFSWVVSFFISAGKRKKKKKKWKGEQVSVGFRFSLCMRHPQKWL